MDSYDAMMCKIYIVIVQKKPTHLRQPGTFFFDFQKVNIFRLDFHDDLTTAVLLRPWRGLSLRGLRSSSESGQTQRGTEDSWRSSRVSEVFQD